MKILVTGGAGFIGSHVVDALCSRDHHVICIDSLEPQVHLSVPTYLNPLAQYYFEDLRFINFDHRFTDVEAVVHLAALGGVSRAAREPDNVIEANCGGTARLVAAMRSWRELQTVALAGSFSIYGSNYQYRCNGCGAPLNAFRRKEDLEAGRYEVVCSMCGCDASIMPITPQASPAPLELYGASKYMQELCFSGFDHCRLQIFRFSSVYGPRLRVDDKEATIVARICGWIRSGQRPQLLEDGRQIRDFVYVGDVVAAIIAAIEGCQSTPVINVCSGLPTTLIQACEEIAKVLGLECDPQVVGGFREGDMRHCLGDAGSMQALIGRSPTTFHEGAKTTFGDSTRTENGAVR